MFLNDNVLDNGLAWAVTNGTHMSICSQEPDNFGEISTYELGKDTVTLGSPTNGDTDGRKTVIGAVSGADVDTGGSSAFWVLHNNSDTIVASNSITSPQTLVSGNTWSLASMPITIRDPS